MERRDFVRSLAGIPLIARPQNKNRRSKHFDERLYHGPMELSEDVMDVAMRGKAYRTTCRHPAIRVGLNGVTYVFRCGLAGQSYLGEIVRISDGALRVHVWKAVQDAPPFAEILERIRQRKEETCSD